MVHEGRCAHIERQRADIPGVDHPCAFDPADVPFAASFDETVSLVATLIDVPIAAITLLNEHRQEFKAVTGMDDIVVPREHAFCRFTVDDRQTFVVPDVELDTRFVNHPLVVGSPGIGAYAGIPLMMPDGEFIGALCAIDTAAHTFDRFDIVVLELLGRQVVAQLQLERMISRQAEDIEILRAARIELSHMAMHDDLTGLLNRRGVITSLARVRTSRTEEMHMVWERGVSVAYVDLDDFKRVNDTLGHEVGDQVLVAVADRLQEICGPDRIIGRLGGDEFIVVMLGASCHSAQVEAVEILAELSKPLTLEEHSLQIDASIGLAHCTGLDNVVAIIDHADRAMYRAKQAGGLEISVWSANNDITETDDRAAKKFVRSTVEPQEDPTDPSPLTVFYQPIFDLHSGNLVRREALLRWTKAAPPDMTVASFIALAEQVGIIHEVGETVLRTACKAAAGWQATSSGVGVAVNVSPLQVKPDLPGTVAEILKVSGLCPSLLTLEVTESSVLDRSRTTAAVLNELHDLGVRLALDDFGTGYASLSMLCALPLDEVKIDRQFSIDSTASTAKVVRATIELGHSLGLGVVAEGIETRETLDWLTGLGCDMGQGYLLGYPAPMRPARTTTESRLASLVASS